jgi:hypothetical protein
MDPASLIDESLNAKPIKKGAVGRPMTKKAKTSSDTDVSADQEAQGVGPSKIKSKKSKASPASVDETGQDGGGVGPSKSKEKKSKK